MNTYNYAEIAKHIFRACRSYAFEYEPIIIFADSLEEAKEKAKETDRCRCTHTFESACTHTHTHTHRRGAVLGF